VGALRILPKLFGKERTSPARYASKRVAEGIAAREGADEVAMKKKRGVDDDLGVPDEEAEDYAEEEEEFYGDDDDDLADDEDFGDGEEEDDAEFDDEYEEEEYDEDEIDDFEEEGSDR